MVRELATLDGLDVAKAESMSTDELRKTLLSAGVNEVEQPKLGEVEKETSEDEENEPQEEEVQEEEQEEQEETEEEVKSEVEDVKPRVNEELEYLKKQNKDLIELLSKNQPTKKEESISENKLTKDEMLDALADDPEAFIRSIIKPEQEKLNKLENKQIRENARRYNPDFARLEPAIDKVMKDFPNIAPNESHAKRLETYYLLVKGLEQQDKEMKATNAEKQKKSERLESKKKASSIPQSKSVKTKTSVEKPIEQLTQAELKAKINSLVA